ncbi:MAG: SEC-C metal-binding domain-containing protein [Nitrospira sp.]|nr:SEC-C metal-binding domain-containing protein [Nitrospira sp.]
MPTEQDIFDELAVLCTSKGFIHAIAFLCFRDNFVRFNDELTAEDTAHMFSDSRLIRTEITTLIGLMMRAPIEFTLPRPEVLIEYIEQSEKLLVELHQALDNAGAKIIKLATATEPPANAFSSGQVLREPIFYSGESAYFFQYRDLAPRKYRADRAWLLQNKNIDLEVGRDVCRSITALLDERLIQTRESLADKPPTDWTMLPGFAFSCDKIAAHTTHTVENVRAVVEAFTAPPGERNATFTSLQSFNAAYAYPFMRRGPDEFLLLQFYGIAEALYDTPFYWMCEDQAYAPIALQHRGEFVESFSFERLKHVFGSARVFQNVEISNSQSRTLGEIDVFVCFGNCAIVLQAKSKKLTILARKGNDLQLHLDFKAAVQDSVDQAFACAELLGDPSVTLRCRDGKTIRLTERPKTIFPISIIADHYPALAFQVLNLLKVKSIDGIKSPLVMDVFTLDATTEMLATPLRLLSYLDLRAMGGSKMVANHETIHLSYHLKYNLWVENNIDLRVLDDNVSSHLDVAMAVRRDGVSGSPTPDGILTRFEGTPFARIISEIEDKENSVAIDLGFILLKLSEAMVRKINEGIGQIRARTMQDGGLHDITFGFSSASTGLTVYCSRLDDREAEIRLRHHCRVRKYSQRANSWFGLAIRQDGSIQLVAKLIGAWTFQHEMEDILGHVRSSHPLQEMERRKIGRNERCPCGSGRKYKNCCL